MLSLRKNQLNGKVKKMASANFEEIKSKNGVCKFKARISEKKELNVTALNGNAYVHISDMKHALKTVNLINRM